jgi:hypothetical protein
VTGFAEDGEGRLWISTYGQGVFVIHQGQMIHFENGDGFPDNDVYCITADETGAIWLGTDNGLVHCAYDGSTKLTERFSESDGLPDLIVKAVKRTTGSFQRLRGNGEKSLPLKRWVAKYG